MTAPLRFGAFFAPFHPVGQNPTLALEYDLERTVELDRLGYDEVWFGEHHSGGYELIGCPEIFIAAAAERTKHIKLGTGVVSLPYHHPWLLADRLVLLDHLTRGRLIIGTGPGALPTDAYIMGIDPVEQRRMMEESLEVVLELFRSEEPVSRETDWFTIREGRLQLRPYTHPHPEVAVAAMISPSGPRLAGKHGVSLLSLSMSAIDGFAAIGKAWGVVEEQAAKAGQPAPDRSTWRVLASMHLAETRDQAIDDCTHGLEDFAGYFGGGAGFVPLAEKVDDDQASPRAFVEAYAAGPGAVIGTPADAIEYIEGMLEQSGGFGTFLMLGHDWADPEATLRSYRLFAREVMPHFKGQLSSARTSHDWATNKRAEIFGRAGEAIVNAITSHAAEQEQAGGATAGDGATNGEGDAKSGATKGNGSATGTATNGDGAPKGNGSAKGAHTGNADDAATAGKAAAPKVAAGKAPAAGKAATGKATREKATASSAKTTADKDAAESAGGKAATRKAKGRTAAGKVG